MNKAIFTFIALLAIVPPLYAMQPKIDTKEALDIILKNVTVIAQNKGKTRKAVENRNKARRSINQAIMILKSQAIPTVLLNSLLSSIQELSTAALKSTYQTDFIQKKIIENVTLIAKTKVDLLEKKEENLTKETNKKIYAITSMVEKQALPSEKGAALINSVSQKKAAVQQQDQKQTESLTTFINNLVGPLITGSYAYTPKELAAMNEEIAEIKEEIADLQEALADTQEPLSTKDKIIIKTYIRKRMAQLNTLLEKTGQKTSTAQKAAAALGASALLWGLYHATKK